ncbi:MAG: nucleoside phosphorylase [Tissierellia bacterium]|nr:nucleoside phosphorylase [Tissierellia bacterium]
MTLQYHLKIGKGDIAPYILLPGDPGRVKKVAEYWDEARLVAENREYITYTGTYKGAPISCTSTGIGCPSTAIAMEELARCGAHTFIRIGTCGAFQDHIRSGDIAIFDSAMRLDGTSHLYAPAEYPAVANYEVINACIKALDKLGYVGHVGTTRTSDAFYARRPAKGSSFGDFDQSNWKYHFDDLKKLNVLASEMEASIIMVLARIWGLRAGGMAAVLHNIMGVEKDSDAFDPEVDMDYSANYIERLAIAGCESILALYEEDKLK